LLAAGSVRTALLLVRIDAVPVVAAAGPWLLTRLPLVPDIAQIIRMTATQTTTIGTTTA
jgi:hypothetical protein